METGEKEGVDSLTEARNQLSVLLLHMLLWSHLGATLKLQELFASEEALQASRAV